MVSKLVKIQLIVFAIIGVLAIIFVGFNYARLDKLAGIGQYPVTVAMGDSSGGIFTNAEVTYRGVPVGRVGKLSLTEKGVNVELLLDSRGPKVPETAPTRLRCSTSKHATRTARGTAFASTGSRTSSARASCRPRKSISRAHSRSPSANSRTACARSRRCST